jgi:hypothetical protein
MSFSLVRESTRATTMMAMSATTPTATPMAMRAALLLLPEDEAAAVVVGISVEACVVGSAADVAETAAAAMRNEFEKKPWL